LTLGVLARQLTKISGKPVRYEGLSASEFIAGRVASGFPEAAAAFLTEWAQAVVQGEFVEVTGDLERLIKRKPTGYREVLKGIYS
jgi:NAD(P)H dehydrogenase (quinone)